MVFVLLNSSAEMCAGSLVLGRRILGIFATRSQVFRVPMSVIWHVWRLYFGVLRDPRTILGRSWDDPGTILGHWGAQRGPVRSRLGFYRFFVDFGDPF